VHERTRQGTEAAAQRPLPAADVTRCGALLFLGPTGSRLLRMRSNGFASPLHPFQVGSWIVFGFDVLTFATFCVPLLDELPHVLGVYALFITSVVVLVWSAYAATGCNPADPYIYTKAEKIPEEIQDTFPQCTICNSSVQPTSKHCRTCDKCVAQFDHHCKWLNNCIGKDNYHAFATAISSVVVMTGIMLATLVYLLYSHFTEDGDGVVSKNLEERYGGMPDSLALVIFFILIVINLPLLLLDMQLLLFHIFLTSRGLTTHEYVIQKAQREESGDSVSWSQKCMTCCMDNMVLRRRRRPGQTSKPQQANGHTSLPTDSDAPSEENGSYPTAAPKVYGAPQFNDGPEPRVQTATNAADHA